MATKAITIALNPIRLSLDVGAAGPVATHGGGNDKVSGELDAASLAGGLFLTHIQSVCVRNAPEWSRMLSLILEDRQVLYCKVPITEEYSTVQSLPPAKGFQNPGFQWEIFPREGAGGQDHTFHTLSKSQVSSEVCTGQCLLCIGQWPAAACTALVKVWYSLQFQ